MEVLAPAGDFENLKACIDNGADAVYLGLSDFNARIKAENFNTENIRKMVQYCHLFDIKVYVTTNTLIKNSEINRFLEFAKCLVEAKIDAFIVQDLGVAKLLKDNFENVVLHASTQMAVHNLDGAKILEKLGFQRVVLSREAKLEDIKQIRQNTGLEIEYFVQGALCVAFSGNCYFSSLFSGCSGNRGKCLQFCRKQYICNDKKGYFISPRDLCLIKSIKELQQAGVDSLKIEGRLRRKAYVAQSVRSYRMAVDNLNNQFDYEQEIEKLSKVFARGKYNESAYLDEKADNVIESNFGNHRGRLIGTVKKVESFKNIYKIIINSKHKIVEGDGLKFIRNGDEKLSVGVGNVDNLGVNTFAIYSTKSPKTGDEVFLSVDSVFEQSLEVEKRRLNIKAKLQAKINLPLKLELFYKNICATVESEQILEQAKTSGATRQDLEKSINKVQDTNFAITGFDFELENVFVPKSLINDVRRRAVELLEEKIIQQNEKHILEKPKKQMCKYAFEKLQNENDKHFVIVNEKNDLKSIENRQVIFSPTNYNGADKFVNLLLENGNKVYLDLPIIANYLDMEILDSLVQKLDPKVGLVANNLWALKYVGDREIVAGQFMNIFNNMAVDLMHDFNIKNIIVSPEILWEEISANDNMFQFTFGKFPMMNFCHCPYKTINHNSCEKCSFDDMLTYSDELKNNFKIRRRKINNCYFELLSGKFIENIESSKFNQVVDIRELDCKEQIIVLESAKEKTKPNIAQEFMFGWIKNGVQ